MSIQITTPTSTEPITLAEAKAHLRVDFTDDDVLIGALISAARQYAENITRRALITQQWKMTLDQFPAPGMNVSSANWYGPQWGNAPGPLSVARADGRTGFEIYMPFPPLQSVESIKYTDQDGVQQTLANTEYKIDTTSEPARIVPAYGKAWPTTRNEINAVEVAFTCGYGAAAAVPEGIKAWIKIRIGSLYENRAEADELQSGSLVKMPFVDSLLDQFRVVIY
jgi:uncharacterized phiE125 gp8 family phage protein